jgi:hypothetical protein
MKNDNTYGCSTQQYVTVVLTEWNVIHEEKLGASELNEQTLFKGDINV